MNFLRQYLFAVSPRMFQCTKRALVPILILLSARAGAQAYFQQKVNTRIEVRLDDKKHFLHGFETINYTNNSRDTLHYIYLHLWPNAYSTDRTWFAEQQVMNRTTNFYFSKAADRGFMDSLDIRIDGRPATLHSSPGVPDVARIDLPAALPPEASIEIKTPFRVKIPLVFSRMGHTGQAYYISQWFPKPAVYDRKGWHPLPYSDQGEFFSEIGSYDVQITLPKNYIVMATGNCENPEENAWLDSLSALPYASLERPKSHVNRWRDSVNRFPPSSTTFKTLRFHEDNIHDFAWFADKRFIVRKDTMNVAAGAGIGAHAVTIYSAALPSESSYWKAATTYMKQTVDYMSKALGPYPYKTVKAVEGDLKAGGGMEYPTVTVIDRLATYTSVMETLVHEVGHNWFYGLLATNERDNAWMDEGFNTFYEQKITRSIRLPMGKKELYANRIEDMLYYDAASTRADQGLTNTSSAYAKMNYGLDVYYKTALLLGWLEGYMGADTFRAAMKDYYARWHYRHPYPEDVEYMFRQHTTKPVGWFFNGALKTEKGINYALKDARVKNGATTIRIKNRSDFAAPVRVNAYEKDALVDSVWSLPFARDTTLLLHNTSALVWRVGTEIPDYYGLNNRYHRYGLLHGKTVRIKGGLDLGRKEDAELYLLPSVGFNIYDGVMAGLLLHNLTVPENKLRYIFAPMYGFRSSDFVGAGSVGYWIYPRRTFSEIVPQIDVKTFHYDTTSYRFADVQRARYIKIAPSLTFVLKNLSPLSPVTRTIMLKGYSIREDGFSYPNDTAEQPSLIHNATNKLYGLLRYRHINERTFNPFSYMLEAQLGSTFSKLTAEGRLRIDYNVKGKGLSLRGFAGKYLKAGGTADDSRYWLASSYTAANDYLYDGTYFGRSEREGFTSRQVNLQEGGGKLATPLYAFPLGRSDDWLAGINIKTDLPITSLPIRLYFDASTYANAEKISPSGSRYLYTGGIELHAVRDIFLVHVPLLMSPDYRDYLKSIYPGKEFANSLSFSIQFQYVNWLRIINTAMKYLN